MAEQRSDQGVWCVVANVAAEQFYEGKPAPLPGTRHFSPNTKVYCYPPQWGDGYEKIKVLGRHRGSQRLVVMVVHETRLTNWRVRRVFHPFVIQQMGGWRSKESAELMVASILIGREAADAVRRGLDNCAPHDALLYALRLRMPEAVAEALQRGAGIAQVRDDGWTALGLAIIYGGIEAVRDLRRRGAGANSVGKYAATAVQMTPTLFHPEVVALVQQYTGSS